MLDLLLEHLTRLVLRRRRIVILCWLLPAPLFLYAFLNVNRKLLTVVLTNPSAQSTFVNISTARDFAKQSQFLALMTFHDPKVQFDAPPFETATREVHKALRPLPCIKALTAYEDLPVRDLFVSKAGHTQVTLIEMEVALNDYHAASRCVQTIRRSIRALGADLGGLEVLVSGPPAIDVDIGRLIRQDSQRAEIIVAFTSLFLLIWMFRSASAALLPLMTAALAVSGSLSVVYLVAHRVELSMYASVVASMTGLGLGLDYALLYVSRFREEREGGREPNEAIIKASLTAGKAILGSGIIVMMGFGGLLIPALRLPQSVGLAGILVVLFTLATTLTLLPVLLSIWHPTMSWPRWRWFKASHRAVDRFWERWSAGVIRRYLILLLVGLVVVGLLGPHLFSLRVRNPRHEAIPMALESRQGMERLVNVIGEEELYRITVLVEIKGEGTWKDERRRAHLLGVLAKIRKWPEVHVVRSADMMTQLFPLLGFGYGFAGRFLSRDQRRVSIDIYGKDSSDDSLNRIVERLRRELPQLFASHPEMRAYVGGNQATFYETKEGIIDAIPVMFPTLAICAFVFMAFFFRSLVIPAKALLLNALSLFTTFGILVLVFQHGHGLFLIGATGPPPGALSVATPILLFGVVFGVSMDYEVFLMTRIQEEWRKRSAGARTREELEAAHRESIHEGLSKTGGIITNAALIMVITFAAFISGTVLPMKEMGFALALAVALDATLVRMLLVPALLRIIGHRTWYWPGGRSADSRAEKQPEEGST
ncbi:MAG: MMPL family transporter [Polyangia bacterium]|jgi:RND superfamily putative drug exporter|nr:MMPL family transporter [Polyangia bacterium]